MQQVLFMQCIDWNIRVLCQDWICYKINFIFDASDAKDWKTPRQTRDCSKQGLECFCQVMADVILVHLDHGNERGLFIPHFRLSTQPNNFGVVVESGDHFGESVRCHLSVCINLQYEFVCLRINSDNRMDRPTNFQFHRSHSFIMVELVKQI